MHGMYKCEINIFLKTPHIEWKNRNVNTLLNSYNNPLSFCVVGVICVQFNTQFYCSNGINSLKHFIIFK